MSWITVILGFLSGLFKSLTGILDVIKSQDLINRGKEEQQTEIAKDEIEINREQTQILSQERTREETIKKLEDGTF